MKRYYFGIDLGTTNSVLGVYDAATDANYTLNIGHSPLVRSMLTIKEDGNVSVGGKYVQGKSIRDVKSSIGNDDVRYLIGGKEFTPIEVSAYVLRKIKEGGEEHFGGTLKIEDVTITVPAKFNHKQRSNTVLAAKMAGLNVVSVINEPTAAALAYTEHESSGKEETILVYDLGGGTFDASVVNIVPKVKALKLPLLKINLEQVDKQIVSVVCSDGDVSLGGNDLDDLTVKKALSNMEITLSENEYVKLREMACDIKEQSLLSLSWTDGDREVNIHDDHFVQASNDIFTRTMTIVQKLLDKHSTIKIDRIVLVGGSTKNKIIRQNMKDWAKRVKINTTIDPDLCVALGAARNTFITLADTGNMSFFDVSSDTVGAEVLHEKGLLMSRMISKGTSLPATYTKNFFRTNMEQEIITVPVYQGENSNCKYNIYLGEVNIRDIPVETPLVEPLKCTFSMDKNGILTCVVSIKDKRESVVIDSKHDGKSGNITNEEVNLLTAMEEILCTKEF